MDKHYVSQNVARAELSKALFIRDDVFKKIKVLSGGEKSKLKLCSMTYNQTNFLILDEPTNHLDIDSREVLEEMLLEFDGTILFVSHDRYFIQKIASRIGEISQRVLNYYEGDYDYYKFLKSKERKEEVYKEVKKVEKKLVVKNRKQKDNNDYLIKELEMIEKKIHSIDKQMIKHGSNQTKLHELYMEKEKLEQSYEELYLKLS